MKRFAIAAILAFLPMSAIAQYSTMTPSYQGLWWRSPAGSESGWGLNIAHQGDILFATWFTYDADGNGMWLVIPSAVRQPDEMGDGYGYGYPMMPNYYDYIGTIYRTTGPAWDSATFDPNAVRVTPAGSATLRFTGINSGTFTYTLDGVMQSKAIVKQQFGPMPVCDFGMAPGAAPNYQDLWWRSPAGSESGWGVNIVHQGDTLFATWFTYDSTGRGLWMVLSNGAKTANGSYSGALYRTRGPAFSTTIWNPSAVQLTEVGAATFTFTDANNGTFSYTVNGVSRSKAITRQVFQVPVTVCR